MIPLYISLGYDCSVAYNIRKLNLAREALPFDWMKIPTINSIISILQNDFDGFCEINQYDIKPQSANFAYCGAHDNSSSASMLTNISNIKSNFKLIHKKYGFILPHEFNGDVLDITKFKAKYTRRIERFRAYTKSTLHDVYFIRLDNANTDKQLEKYKINQIKLNTTLKTYFSIVNLKTVYINEYTFINLLDITTFQWTRQYIPWADILIA